MGLFRRRPPDLATLLERREQLLAEIEERWTPMPRGRRCQTTRGLSESRSLRRQTDALKRALGDLEGQITAARPRGAEC